MCTCDLPDMHTLAQPLGLQPSDFGHTYLVPMLQLLHVIYIKFCCILRGWIKGFNSAIYVCYKVSAGSYKTVVGYITIE